MVDGVDVVQQVHAVLDKIKAFSEEIRSGAIRGATGKRIRNIVAVGIGGSYLGPACIHEVFKTEEEGSVTSEDFQLRFLSNVDPVDVSRAQVRCWCWCWLGVEMWICVSWMDGRSFPSIPRPPTPTPTH